MSQRTERRCHVVYITQNTEYHCRLRECVAVRDRRTGHWRRDHWAVRGQLVGSVHNREVQRTPGVGGRLLIEGGRAILTSRVEMVGRPDRSAIFRYSSQAWTGQIG